MKLSNFNIFGLFLITICLIGLSACTDSKNEKPNFLIILIDDLGSQDVGAYGQKYMQTPNIDALAGEGMRWTNANSSCPVCSPTRAAILTGKSTARVHFTGHITAIERHRYPENSRIIPPDDLMYIPKEEIILAEALRPAGYTSISIGKWHVGGEGYWPTDQGFDYNIGGWTHGSPPGYFYPYISEEKDWNSNIPTLSGGKDGEYLTDRLTDEAIDFMQKHQGEPFLMYLSHYAVHTPLQGPHELVDKYKKILKNTKIDPVYAAMVENVDWNIGRVMKELDDLGLAKETVVIFASDNGAVAGITDNHPFREGKGHLYEGGLRVPYIMRWPGHIMPGTVCEKPTISEDIYSTIVDIAGKEAVFNSPVDGRSLVSDFTKTENSTDGRELHWYYPHYVGHSMQPGAAIRSGSYKLIEFYDPPRVELYNLVEDISERNDLLGEMPEKKQELLDKLHQWLKYSGTIMHTMNPNFNE